MFKAKDIMTKDVVTVSPQDTIDRAIALILDHAISGLPVVDDEGQLRGIVSQFDLLLVICDCQSEKDQVWQYMSPEVVSVDEEADWNAIADILRSRQIQRLPVTRDGRLAGILTRHDMMQSIQKARRHFRELLAAR
jgi:CBS domain-containing protein